MSSAQVHALERLANFQALLQNFRVKANDAMGSNRMEISRRLDWLETQLQLWKAEIRRAEEAVIVARNELLRKRAMRMGDRPTDTTDQEKTLRKAQERLAHAVEKRDQTKAWLLRYPDAVQEYDGKAKPFQDVLDIEMNKMILFLEQKRTALEAYQQINPGAGGAS